MAAEETDPAAPMYTAPAVGSVFPVPQSTTAWYGAACASDLGLQSLDVGACFQDICAPGGNHSMWNASFSGLQHIAPPDVGTYGSFQALLHNVSYKLPFMEADAQYLHENAPVPKKDHGISVDKVTEDVEMDMSPSRDDVDESGYLSSDSSVYAVNSDDERVDNVVTNIQEEDDEHLNLSGYKTNEEDITTSSQPSDDAAGVLEKCPCLTSNPFMHVMTEVPEGNAGTWKRRNRNPNVRPDCRVPKGMGAIEIALRNAPYRKTKYIFEPLIGLTFDSEDEAYEFYNMYSWEVGFGIKKKGIANNNKARNLTSRDYRCLCADTPKDCKYNSKKTGCKAMLRLLRTEDDGWYIRLHVAEHNHPLTESCGQTKEWFSHGKLDMRAMDMIKYLRENNVSLAKVHCIMGSMYGSMDKIPVTKRSLRSICHGIAKDQMDDDVQKTLRAFQELRKKDPDFQFTVDPGTNNRIKSLLWINGRSRDQYKCFGDVITFDTTYCTNIYKMPFGLFVGVNNHFQSTIFGGVFMTDETIPSFEWVFKEFVSLMGGKVPNTIFTDQCAAMAAALSNVWKEAKHLLCKWHVFKDAPAKLGPIYKKGSKFRKLFHKIINDMLTIDEFERAWDYMLERFDLRKNKYLSDLYDKRDQWAKPFFRDTFCARMSSTQRSESANHMLKTFVPRHCSMNRFVLQFNKLLFDRNSAEDRAEFETKIVNDVRQRAWPIEEHAMKFYTKAVYGLFRKEIDKSTNYFAIEKVDNKEYDVVHVKPNKKLPWDREKMTVLVNEDGESYDCECGLYQHFGVLCSHVLRVMVQRGVAEIPKAHINKRWTTSARDILPVGFKAYEQENLCLDSMTFRHSYLYLNAISVVDDGNKDLGAFEIVAKELKNIQNKLKAYFSSKETLSEAGCSRQTLVQPADCSRETLVQPNYYTSESEACVDTETEKEGRLCNSYGAAGSSAELSDSDLMRIRAPALIRPPGRPRLQRLKGALDYFEVRKPKKVRSKTRSKNVEEDNNETVVKKGKRKMRCRSCKLLGHSSAQCTKKVVHLDSDIPEV